MAKTKRYGLYLGDSLTVLSRLKDNSVSVVVTDPPYGLGESPDALDMLRYWVNGEDYPHKSKKGFMSHEWDAFVPQPRFWREVFRVLKPGGYVLSFFGTRNYDLGVLSLRLAGFEIKEQIAWIYGSGMPKSRNVYNDLVKAKSGSKSKRNIEKYKGYGFGLKPALEPIAVCRKPLAEKNLSLNILQWGTGCLNIDACRVDFAEVDDHRIGKNRQHAASYVFGLDNKQGRFPANVIHDGSSDVLAAFPSASGSQGQVRDSQRSQKACYGKTSDTGKVYKPRLDVGSAARFFYCAKTSRKERNEGLDRLPNIDIAESNTNLQSLKKNLNTSSGKPRNLISLQKIITLPSNL